MVDVTLFGATGFTGALTAEYLSQHIPEGASWAIAGRNRDKLASVAARIAAAGGTEPHVVTADVENEAEMLAMARDTRVLVSTVGPYLKYGEAAVRAAAQAGTDYVDLTGEPQFVDEMWLNHQETARSTGSRLVHACGFDSIPYDLGVLYTVNQLPGDVPVHIKGYVRTNGSVSGGTYHSALNQMGSLREAQKVAKRRRSLETRASDRTVRGAGRLARADHAAGWAVPLPTIDPQIVLRSARALAAYGPEFTYEHYAHVKTTRMLLGGGVVIGALGLGAQIPPIRTALGKVKDPGSGPSPEERAEAWYTVDLLAEAGDRRLHTRVTGKDPGYGGTAQMLSQSALCLAFDDLPPVAGQTTTAESMGQALIDRLHPDTVTFSTV